MSLATGYVISLLALVVVNAVVVTPMALDFAADATSNRQNDTTNSSSLASQDPSISAFTGDGCFRKGSDGDVLTDIINFIKYAPVVGNILRGITNLLFGVEEVPGTCSAEAGFISIGAFDVFGSPLIMAAVFLTIGGAVLLSGFLTAGASKGAIAVLGWGIIIGGLTASALLSIKPMFEAIPVVGVPVYLLYSAAGVVIVLTEGLSILSGGGE